MQRNYNILDMLLSINPHSFEERFKSAERSVETMLEPPIAVRLDGVGFGKALAGFKWPRDYRVHLALLDAASALLERMNGRMAYIGSDEINIIVMDELPYSGRLEKIVSISAGLASSIVSLKLSRNLFFDSRVVPLRDERDALEYLLYRARIVFNNYVNSLLKAHGFRVESLDGHLIDRIRLARSAGLDPLREPWAALGSCIYRVTTRRHIEPIGIAVERRRVIEVDGPCLPDIVLKGY